MEHKEGRVRNDTDSAYIQTVKQIVVGILVFNEELEILEDALVHFHAVFVLDTVLSEKVKVHDKVFAVQLVVQLDVFHAERAAADRVGRFAFLLFVTSTKSELHKTEKI